MQLALDVTLTPSVLRGGLGLDPVLEHFQGPLPSHSHPREP